MFRVKYIYIYLWLLQNYIGLNNVFLSVRIAKHTPNSLEVNSTLA